MSYESERLKILEMIDNGLISVDEGVALLKALDQRQAEPGAAVESLEELDPEAASEKAVPGTEPVGETAFTENVAFELSSRNF
jgi:hypothetical protein